MDESNAAEEGTYRSGAGCAPLVAVSMDSTAAGLPVLLYLLWTWRMGYRLLAEYKVLPEKYGIVLDTLR